jgi:hypothetical protein
LEISYDPELSHNGGMVTLDTLRGEWRQSTNPLRRPRAETNGQIQWVSRTKGIVPDVFRARHPTKTRGDSLFTLCALP